MSDFKELVLGGSRLRLTNKRACLDADTKFKNPTYLDISPDEGVDVVWDLNNHPLPFEDNTFDEIYAYNILEYLASQGNTTFFYEEFDEYHRIIKPNGILHIIVPEINKPAAWADPGITRVLPPSVFKILEKTWKLVISRSIGEHMYIKLQAI